MTSRIVLLALVALLAGCASSRLMVHVDLYDEDPRLDPPMGPTEAMGMINDVEQLRAAAAERTSQRVLLATMSRDIFVDTWLQANGNSAKTDSVIAKHQAYKADAEKVLGELQDPLNRAVDELQRYITIYQQEYETASGAFRACEAYRVADDDARSALTQPEDCQLPDESKRVTRLSDEWIIRRLPVSLRTEEAKARAKVAQAAAAYRGFASPLATSFMVDWAGLRSVLYSGLELAQANGLDLRANQFERTIYSFNARLADLAAASKLIPKEELAEVVAARSTQSARGLLDATMRLAVEIETLRSQLPDNATAQTALAGLVRGSTQFLEQIDRLQDHGNPVWRIVTDPANAGHWNALMPPLTAFYAQGKSSVAIVRHDPKRFEVHEGTNNPAALIQGQLEISRAIANAALSVAGTPSGLRLPGEAQQPATESEAGTASSAAAAVIRRKADAEEARRVRERTIRGLELALAGIQANLAAGGNSAEVLRNQRSRLESVLKAYRLQLDPSGQ